VLMKDSRSGMGVSAVSLVLTGIIFCFTGWAMIWPVILVIIWILYLHIKNQSDGRITGE